MDGVSYVNALSYNWGEELKAGTSLAVDTANADSFESLYNSAVAMVTNTNDLQDAAETEEINFALGYSDNTHTLQIAQEKANIALQYTVAVRDRFLEAYETIMNMQI